jgi:hypothetical protein
VIFRELAVRLFKCSLCGGSTRAPTIATQWLLQESHLGVGLAKCRCGKSWLRLWVEIFDDLWDFWSPMDQSEAESVEKADAAQVSKVAKNIIRQHTVLSRGPIRSEWINGANALLDGPPW